MPYFVLALTVCPMSSLSAAYRHPKSSPLGEPVPTHSPYSLILSQIESAASCGELPAQTRHSMESVAYGIWALVEGIVSLQRTHLREFDADFEEADRRALVALINGYTNEEITQ